MFHVPCILVFTVSSCQHSYAHVMGPPMHVVGGGAGLWKKSVMYNLCEESVCLSRVIIERFIEDYAHDTLNVDQSNHSYHHLSKP